MKFRTKSADYILQFRPVNRVYRFFVIWPHSWSAGLFQWSRNLTLHKVHKMQDWHFQNRIVMHMAFLMQLKACTVTLSVCDHAIDQQPGRHRPREQQRHWQKKKKENTSAKIQRGWKEKDSISGVGTERRIQEILEIERNGQQFFWNFN